MLPIPTALTKTQPISPPTPINIINSLSDLLTLNTDDALLWDAAFLAHSALSTTEATAS
ncbi:hypothetical protein KCP71_07065 [Salmonella enterica subsp. enterica]|nr:hypothetical protein KCP71_07065 [Salmonella enterica subsp. enterica]